MSQPALDLPSLPRHVLIATNPHAGSGAALARVAELTRLLEAQGFAVQSTTDLEETRTKAATLQSQGQLWAVVAAGGDGTVSALVNRLGPEIPLAILPLGTENLLARYIGQRRSPKAVARTISGGLSVRLDAARAGDRIVVLMLSAGFDAEVARKLHEQRSGPSSHRKWIKPIWQTIRSYTYPCLRVSFPGGGSQEESPAEPISARWVFAVNLPRYACGLRFAPQAVGTDRLLDVCTFRRGSLLHGLRYLLSVLLRVHQRLGDCKMTRAPRVRIEADVPVPYQFDGEFGGWLPVEVEILPGRLNLVVPGDFALQNCFELALAVD